jgi:hypothetical protein
MVPSGVWPRAVTSRFGERGERSRRFVWKLEQGVLQLALQGYSIVCGLTSRILTEEQSPFRVKNLPVRGGRSEEQ